MAEGKPQGEAQDNVPQTAVQTNDTWQTGTPKNPSDGEKQEYWAQEGDGQAGAGRTTSQAQQVAGTLDPRPGTQGGDAINPPSFGGLKDGLPASGAAANPQKTVDGDKKT
jgi:hypothetical protein